MLLERGCLTLRRCWPGLLPVTGQARCQRQRSLHLREDYHHRCHPDPAVQLDWMPGCSAVPMHHPHGWWPACPGCQCLSWWGGSCTGSAAPGALPRWWQCLPPGTCWPLRGHPEANNAARLSMNGAAEHLIDLLLCTGPAGFSMMPCNLQNKPWMGETPLVSATDQVLQGA